MAKLDLFNAALDELGYEPLVDTGEAVEKGRVLNRQYQRVVNDCIAAGSWNFATETVQLDADTGVTPEFGFPEVFAKPSDWVRTVAISEDENFSMPLLRYYDDATYWSADATPIYVRYVSDDTGMGWDLQRWTAAFTRYVEFEMAVRAAPRLLLDKSALADLEKRRDKARKTALNQDSMNEPNPKFPPPGRWTLARGGGTGNDRGSRGRLIG